MSKKKPRYLTDRHYYGHPSNHMPYLVICTAALLIAAAVGALLLSMAWDYTTARYQLEVDAVLVDIRGIISRARTRPAPPQSEPPAHIPSRSILSTGSMR